MATYDQIRAAFEATLATAWGSTTPISWPNRPFNPGGSAAWIRPSLLWGQFWRETIGGATPSGQRCAGIYHIEVFVRQDTGTGVLNGHINTLTTIFNEQTLATADGGHVICEVPRLVHMGPDEPPWYKANLDVPWWHQRP